MTLGGEGSTYDIREVAKLAKAAELFSEKLDTLGKMRIVSTFLFITLTCYCRHEIFCGWRIDLRVNG